MIICKICNPTLEGNGYCAEHSTSGMAYLEKSPMSNSLKKKLKEKIEKAYWKGYRNGDKDGRKIAREDMIEVLKQLNKRHYA